MNAHVLDSSALMALFENRAGADKVEDLLARAVDTKISLLMSVVNWGEVYYSVWRARGQELAETKLGEIAQLPIEIVNADAELTKLAASLKALHNLPYADSFAAALARAKGVPLVTSDKDFQRVAGLVRFSGYDSVPALCYCRSLLRKACDSSCARLVYNYDFTIGLPLQRGPEQSQRLTLPPESCLPLGLKVGEPVLPDHAAHQ